MKIILASDSHGDSGVLSRIARLNYADMYLFAGDSEAPGREILPFLGVKGNCDAGFDYPSHLKMDTPMGILYMSHYPPDKELLKRLYLEGVRIYVHGHTHIRRNEELLGIRIICPGSVARPRDMKGPSYALLEIGDGGAKVSFKDIG